MFVKKKVLVMSDCENNVKFDEIFNFSLIDIINSKNKHDPGEQWRLGPESLVCARTARRRPSPTTAPCSRSGTSSTSPTEDQSLTPWAAGDLRWVFPIVS